MTDLKTLRGYKELGQIRPSDATATELYAPSFGILGIVMSIHVVNTTGSGATYRVFADKDGTTTSEETAIAGFDTTLDANNWVLIEFVNGVPIDGSLNGTLYAATDTGSALTFTAYGVEVSR